MASLRVLSLFTVGLFVALVTCPLNCQAQTPDPAPVGMNTALSGPWEFTFDGRIGVPTGRLKVGEFPTGPFKAGGGGTPGTSLRLRDLGIDVSGALEASVAFHLISRDAVRASYLYYFLRGSTTVDGPSVVFKRLGVHHRVHWTRTRTSTA